MASRSFTFREADIKRAVKGATAGGLVIGRIEISPSGDIVIVSQTAPENQERDPLAVWEMSHNARKT